MYVFYHNSIFCGTILVYWRENESIKIDFSRRENFEYKAYILRPSFNYIMLGAYNNNHIYQALKKMYFTLNISLLNFLFKGAAGLDSSFPFKEKYRIITSEKNPAWPWTWTSHLHAFKAKYVPSMSTLADWSTRSFHTSPTSFPVSLSS